MRRVGFFLEGDKGGTSGGGGEVYVDKVYVLSLSQINFQRAICNRQGAKRVATEGVSMITSISENFS